MLYFKEESKIILEIDSFALDKPIHIKHNNLFLSCQKTANIVEFSLTPDEWIIEPDKETDVFYIKHNFLRNDGALYLGNPNREQRVFLYTKKNRFTKWQIINVEENRYIFKYVGDKFNKQEHTIVVSRYNENLDWLLPYNDCVTVYNKGKDAVNLKTVHTLKNIGREGHTYLYHIIENYNALSDRITFIQGDSLPHNETLLYGLDNFERFSAFQPLGLRWLEECQIPPNSILNKYKQITDYGLNYLVIQINGNLDYLNAYYFFDGGLVIVKNRYIKT